MAGCSEGWLGSGTARRAQLMTTTTPRRTSKLMLCRVHSPKQAIKRLVDAVINFIGRWVDRLELGQGGAELGLAHRPLLLENRSHNPELKVLYQDLVREMANRLDQINYDFSLAIIHRHGNFSIGTVTSPSAR
jgi:hypothetical protein